MPINLPLIQILRILKEDKLLAHAHNLYILLIFNALIQKSILVSKHNVPIIPISKFHNELLLALVLLYIQQSGIPTFSGDLDLAEASW